MSPSWGWAWPAFSPGSDLARAVNQLNLFGGALRKHLAEQGLDAQMPDVAKAAAVGVGTVYRHFPAKEDLVFPREEEIRGTLEGLAAQVLSSDQVRTAVAAGITDLVFITGRNKRAIEDHFDTAYELEAELEAAQKQQLLELVQNVIPKNVNCIYIRQSAPLGLGHAVLCARPVVGDEPFAVLLADDLIWNRGRGALGQMVDLAGREQASVIAVQDVPREQTGSYGIVATRDFTGHHGEIDAIDTIRDLLGVKSVHAIGYCVAGTYLAATLALLAARGDADKVASATFFTAQVDFAEAGDLKLFLGDETMGLLQQLGLVPTPFGSAPGGTTRRVCPTSMRLGLSMLFQRAMSRQFCPLSSEIRISVSPGRTE